MTSWSLLHSKYASPIIPHDSSQPKSLEPSSTLVTPLSFTHTQAVRISLLISGFTVYSHSLPHSLRCHLLSLSSQHLDLDSLNTLRIHLSAYAFVPSCLPPTEQLGWLVSKGDQTLSFLLKTWWAPSLLPSGFQSSSLALPSNSKTSSPTNPSLKHPSPSRSPSSQIHWGLASLFPLPEHFFLESPWHNSLCHFPNKACSDDYNIDCHPLHSPPPLFHPTTSL